MSSYIPIGTVTKAVGLDGSLKAAVYGDVLLAIDIPCSIYLVRQQFSHKLVTLETLPTGAAEYTLLSRRPTGKGDVVRITLAGIEDRSVAEQFSGMEIYVSEQLCPPAEAGEFYAWQLVGLAVYPSGGSTARGSSEEEPLATVAGVLHYGSRPNLKLELSNGQTCQVPLVDEFVTKIDVNQGRIEVDHLDSFLP